MADALAEKSRELTEEGRRRDEFLAMLGHELRNPLGALTLSLHLMERCEPGDERAARAQKTCVSQVESLTRMVNELLDVSRITQGKVELKKQPVDLGSLVRNVLASARRPPSRPSQSAAEKPSNVERDWSITASIPDGPVMVEGDSTRLEQVVGNLLSNAFAFAGDDSRLEVTVLAPDSAVAELRIRDYGRGIPTTMLERIFDLFVQVDPAQHRLDGGLGIGLTVARSLVKKHGGTIEARSEGPGTGAELVVRLPRIAPASGIVDVAEAGEERATAGRRILLVEDDEDVRDALMELLEEAGHHLQVAATGREGVRIAATSRPEIVFLDIGLPDIDGYEAARQIRATTGTGVHLIALTGYGRVTDQVRALEAGFERHLVKPVKVTALFQLLDTLAEPAIGDRTPTASKSP